MQNNPMSEVAAACSLKEKSQDESFPVQARENIKRHCDDLTRLADNLRKLGIDQEEIDGHVIEIFKGYERELLASIERIKAARLNI